MTSEILSQEARLFLSALRINFEPKIKKILKEREQRKTSPHKYSSPNFIPETGNIRDGDWNVLPPPSEIEDRRVEITGPPERKMIINALNSGANVYMADFEDSNCPTWSNCLQGQINLHGTNREGLTGLIETNEVR